MAKRQDIQQIPFSWPYKGLNRRFAAGSQPNYSTIDAVNVWPDSAGVPSTATQADYIRQRGGSRVGLSKAFATQIGGGAPIKAMETIQFIQNDQLNRRLVAISNGTLY